MSKKYYIQLGIAVRISMAFHRFCNESQHMLVEEKPENFDELAEDEQKISLTYWIRDSQNANLASFHPSGKYDCFDENFRPIYDQIVDELHYAASKASIAQDEQYRRMKKEFERSLNEKFKKNGNFSQ